MAEPSPNVSAIINDFGTVLGRQVGHGGVDRASSSDARGPGFEPRPLHLKKYHFFTRNQVALRS